MGDYYSLEFANVWMGLKETAFRTNSHGKDTANVAGDSFRRFPIKWEDMVNPRPLPYRVIKKRNAGKGLDWGSATQNGKEDGKMTISGEVIDFAFLYQLCGASTYDAGPPKTHTYITSTSSVTPTFQILQKVGNVDGDETQYILYTGCKITECHLNWDEGSGLRGSLTIEFANTIDGVALTSEPAWLTSNPYYFDPLSAFVWKEDTTQYNGYCSSWHLYFNNGEKLRKCGWEVLADRVISNYRTIELEWTWVSEEKLDWTNSQKTPLLQDFNLTHTLSNGTDSLVMTWAKMLIEMGEQSYDYKDFYLGRKYKACLNPVLTSTLQFVETNTSDATFYGG